MTLTQRVGVSRPFLLFIMLCTAGIQALFINALSIDKHILICYNNKLYEILQRSFYYGMDRFKRTA